MGRLARLAAGWLSLGLVLTLLTALIVWHITASRPTTAPYIRCATGPDCLVTVPACGSYVMGAGWQTLTSQIPPNVDDVLGFRPAFATWLPTGMTFDEATLIGPAWQPGRSTFIESSYGIWVPRPNHTVGLQGMLTLYETSGPLEPQTGIRAGGPSLDAITAPVSLAVTQRDDIQIGAVHGTLYHLAPADGRSGPHVVSLIWKDGQVTLRLNVATGGLYYTDVANFTVSEWPTASDTSTLVRIAASVAPYPACPSASPTLGS